MRLKMIWVIITTLSLVIATAVSAEQHFAAQRERMIQAIQSIATSVPSQETAINPAVITAMREVPRHELVPAKVRDDAYENHPLFIGHGQTISQPYIVALMTSLARPAKDHVVLEVGTGSGYQAAVLSRLVARVYSIEIVEPLAREAAANLKKLGYDNIHVRAGDGYKGWPERAPFDAIVVTAAANHVPQPLVDQLKPGGRLVIPVGATSMSQRLMVIEKDERGEAHTRAIVPVRFVPLTGEGEGGPPTR
jgi:protein-L-isoaspartate(D-aspartate) O-methyltransferase